MRAGLLGPAQDGTELHADQGVSRALGLGRGRRLGLLLVGGRVLGQQAGFEASASAAPRIVWK
jgi:hypothetical protein